MRLLCGVAHEQRREPGPLEPQHERGHVDAWIVLGREHLQRRVADPDTCARREGATWHARSRDAFVPRAGHRSGIQADGLDREADLVAVEERDEAIRVIGMRMRECDDINASLPGRQAGAELREQTAGIRTTVDK